MTMASNTSKTPNAAEETTGHEWDGIQELNNPLPKWWLYTFYACVLYAVVWCVLYPSVPGVSSYFAGTLGYSQRDEVAANIQAAAAGQARFRDRIRDLPVEQVKADPELQRFALSGGRVLFAENCAGCHQSGGVGAKGYPNLADDDWLWGGSLQEIETTLRVGIRAMHAETRVSQMPRFLADGILPMRDIEAVADHVLSLSGGGRTNAEGAKLYADNCVACHGEAGTGNRELGAPSLADKIWLYGGDRTSVIQSIAQSRNGVMPSWTGRLDDATIKMLAVYVHAMGGGE